MFLKESKMLLPPVRDLFEEANLQRRRAKRQRLTGYGLVLLGVVAFIYFANK